MRVAFTLEQCWHAVPGGTAVAALELARALDDRGDVELVGVAARHRADPPEPWVPPIRVHQLPLPRLALYEAWHRLRRPSVERATGAVDVIHATGIAMPPASRPVVVTVHDLAYLDYPAMFSRAGLSFFRRALDLTLADARLVLCSSLRRSPAVARRDSTRLGSDTCRSACGSSRRPMSGYGRCVPVSASRASTSCGRGPSSRGRTSAGSSRLSHGSTSRSSSRSSGLRDGTRTSSWSSPRCRARFATASTGSAGSPATTSPRSTQARPSSASRACSRGSASPSSRRWRTGRRSSTSTGTSTEELVADGAGLAVTPTDVDAIAEAISRILSDGPLAAALAAAGARRAAEYTWERSAALVEQAYADASAS